MNKLKEGFKPTQEDYKEIEEDMEQIIKEEKEIQQQIEKALTTKEIERINKQIKAKSKHNNYNLTYDSYFKIGYRSVDVASKLLSDIYGENIELLKLINGEFPGLFDGKNALYTDLLFEAKDGGIYLIEMQRKKDDDMINRLINYIVAIISSKRMAGEDYKNVNIKVVLLNLVTPRNKSNNKLQTFGIMEKINLANIYSEETIMKLIDQNINKIIDSGEERWYNKEEIKNLFLESINSIIEVIPSPFNITVVYLRKRNQSGVSKELKRSIDFMLANSDEKRKEIAKGCKILEKMMWRLDYMLNNNYVMDPIERTRKMLDAYASSKYEKGIQKGIQKGRKESNIDIAKNMYKRSFDINIISEVTGLSVNKLLALFSL